MNVIKDRLALKLLLTILFCFVISAGGFLAITHYVSWSYLGSEARLANLDVQQYNILLLGTFFLSMCIFVAAFLSMVNRKMHYLRHITDGVNKISLGNLSTTLDIQGKDELAQLAVGINSMAREVENRFNYQRVIEAGKNELIANISHDLRSPLTSILGYVDLIKNNGFHCDEQSQDYIETISVKAQSLETLINELFEYTRLSSPGLKLKMERVELGGLIQQLLGEYTPIFESKGLSFIRDIANEDIFISGDVVKIVRMLENILSNADKYSPKPTAIRVKLAQTQDRVLLSISNQMARKPDVGPNKLFERFYKGDTSRTQQGGTGLGLAIAKLIMELHGGRIWGQYEDDMITFHMEFECESFRSLLC